MSDSSCVFCSQRLVPEALALLPEGTTSETGSNEPQSLATPAEPEAAHVPDDAPSVKLSPTSDPSDVQSALSHLASRQDANAPWPSTFQLLDATQGRKAMLTYTADASVVHAWLLAHVLQPCIPLLGLDTEWSSTQPTVAVLQLATADAALVFHASVGTRRSPDAFDTPLDRWLATAVTQGFAAWEAARKAGTALPRVQLPSALSAALAAQMGAPEAVWSEDVPSEYAPAWPPQDDGVAHSDVPVVQPLGACSYLPSGLVAMASAFASDGAQPDLQAATCEELKLHIRPRVAGVAIEQDTSNLEKNWGVQRMASVDTAALAGDLGLPAGLARQSRQLHGTHTWKSRKLHSVGNWNLGPLTTRPLEYAARDALYSRLNADYALAYRSALQSSPSQSSSRAAALPKHAKYGIGQPWENDKTRIALKQSFSYLSDPLLVHADT